MKRWLLGAVLLGLAGCGGGSTEAQRPSLLLSFKEAPQVAYFSRILLRVSYPEGEPYTEDRRGRFLPGDVVVFELKIPEGKERTLEVFLYDPQGKPVYYRSVYLPELTEKDTIKVELLPSEGNIRTYELRSDGKVEAERRVRLFSEDLYSDNGDFEGFLVGKFARIVEGRRVYFYFIEEGRRELSLDFEGERKIELETPQVMWLSGSAEVYAGGRLETTVRSSALTTQDRALLCGLEGSSVYHVFSSSPLELSKACEGQTCTAISLSYGPFLTPAEVLLSQGGILCRGGYLESDSRARAYAPEGASLLVGFYVSHPGACKPQGMLFLKAEGGQVVASTGLSSFNVPSPSVWRIFSQDGMYNLQANCTVPNSVSFQVPYAEDREVFVEKLEGDRVYAKRMKLSSLGSWSWGKEDIRSIQVKEEEEYLLVRFETEGSFSRCHLWINYADRKVYVLNIPPYRKHLKLRRQYLGSAEGSVSGLRLRCESDSGYAERRISLETNAL